MRYLIVIVVLVFVTVSGISWLRGDLWPFESETIQSRPQQTSKPILSSPLYELSQSVSSREDASEPVDSEAKPQILGAVLDPDDHQPAQLPMRRIGEFLAVDVNPSEMATRAPRSIGEYLDVDSLVLKRSRQSIGEWVPVDDLDQVSSTLIERQAINIGPVIDVEVGR